MTHIKAQHMTAEAFAPFGDVIEVGDSPDRLINAGMCKRFHDLAQLDIADNAVGLSLFQADLRRLPYELNLMERHPLGAQCFIPMCRNSFLVTVAPDANGRPGEPQAFLTSPGQAINFRRSTWHGVLTPLQGSGLFAVIDYVGEAPNLEEFPFETPYLVLDES